MPILVIGRGAHKQLTISMQYITYGIQQTIILYLAQNKVKYRIRPSLMSLTGDESG